MYRIGVRQGDNFSPLLFALFVNDFTQHVTKVCHGLNISDTRYYWYVTKLIKVHKITYYKDRLGNADNKRALPDFNSLYDGCVVFSDLFSEKVKMIVMNLENNNINVEIPVFNNTLSDFRDTAETEVYNICMNTKKTCSLDPLPISVLQQCFQSVAPAYTHIINTSLSG